MPGGWGGRWVPRVSPPLGAARGVPQVCPQRAVLLHVPAPSCCPDVWEREVALAPAGTPVHAGRAQAHSPSAGAGWSLDEQTD